MRRIIKWVIGIAVINAVIWAVGQAITRSRSTADHTADEVELYTFWNGAEYSLGSQSLRRVKARILMGGASIDLREAIPSPDGTIVDVGTLMGGTAVLVRKDWDVEVVEQTTAGEVEISLDTGAEVDSDQPKVTVRLTTTMGGALVGYELPSRDGG